jgi:DNA adenine methylase
LTLVDTIYTDFESALFRVTTPEPGELSNFINILQERLLTYDDTPEIRVLADKYKLQYKTIPMKTTHHLEKNELVISDNFSWWKY